MTRQATFVTCQSALVKSISPLNLPRKPGKNADSQAISRTGYRQRPRWGEPESLREFATPVKPCFYRGKPGKSGQKHPLSASGIRMDTHLNLQVRATDPSNPNPDDDSIGSRVRSAEVYRSTCNAQGVNKYFFCEFRNDALCQPPPPSIPCIGQTSPVTTIAGFVKLPAGSSRQFFLWPPLNRIHPNLILWRHPFPAFPGLLHLHPGAHWVRTGHAPPRNTRTGKTASPMLPLS